MSQKTNQNNITLFEFQSLSQRTMPYGGKPKYVHDYNNFLLNYSLGLVGEAIEVVEAFENSLAFDHNVQVLLKELGDVAHYAVGLVEYYQVDLDNPPRIKNHFSISENVRSLLSNAKEVSEHTKKKVFHDHDEPFSSDWIYNIFESISGVAESLDYSLEDVLSLNIEKLRKRYPEGFSSEDSVERADV